MSTTNNKFDKATILSRSIMSNKDASDFISRFKIDRLLDINDLHIDHLLLLGNEFKNIMENIRTINSILNIRSNHG